ncbi:related to ribosomal protein YmL32 precursor (mitochondrial) [Phialocephala subalpina]|uniref:Large ribosomal subunit protein bL32m n=1 Tax=Phialocephala subalpina TaxID=576137 RepID=A0A1L7X3U4_9HELO|nr:related to ribosomal protein YmL32 precursor (mitochondrial) [Phialocephala subalpina]
MAVAHTTTRSILSSFLPRFSAPTISKASPFTTLFSRQLSHPLLPSLSIGVPAAISLNVPGFIEGLWESILKAVPKKKTSHSKKRSRLLAGKAMKDVTALNKCSACGHIKRAHLLCPYCVAEIKEMFKGRDMHDTKKTTSEKPEDV